MLSWSEYLAKKSLPAHLAYLHNWLWVRSKRMVWSNEANAHPPRIAAALYIAAASVVMQVVDLYRAYPRQGQLLAFLGLFYFTVRLNEHLVLALALLLVLFGIYKAIIDMVKLQVRDRNQEIKRLFLVSTRLSAEILESHRQNIAILDNRIHRARRRKHYATRSPYGSSWAEGEQPLPDPAEEALAREVDAYYIVLGFREADRRRQQAAAPAPDFSETKLE